MLLQDPALKTVSLGSQFTGGAGRKNVWLPPAVPAWLWPALLVWSKSCCCGFGMGVKCRVKAQIQVGQTPPSWRCFVWRWWWAAELKPPTIHCSRGFKLCYCPESSEPVIAVAGAPELSDVQDWTLDMVRTLKRGNFSLDPRTDILQREKTYRKTKEHSFTFPPLGFKLG